MVRWGEGGRSLRICSFRGSYANRGNGMQQAFSDVVRRAGLEPANLPASDFETDSYACSGICAYGTQRGRKLKPLHTVLWWARLDLNQQCPSGTGFTVRCGTNYALLTRMGSPSKRGSIGRRRKETADVEFSRLLRKPRKRNGAGFFRRGDPCGTRTHICSLRGCRPDRLDEGAIGDRGGARTRNLLRDRQTR